jgi:hypothetical protein
MSKVAPAREDEIVDLAEDEQAPQQGEHAPSMGTTPELDADWGGADFFIEAHDTLWLRVAYCLLVLTTLLVPFAITFGEVIVLWAWWGVSVVICVSVWVMRITNDTIPAIHGNVLLMVSIVILRYPVLWTFHGDFASAIVSSFQLVVLLFNMVWRPHPLTGTALFGVVLLLTEDIYYTSGETSVSTWTATSFVLSLSAFAGTYVWDNLKCMKERTAKCYESATQTVKPHGGLSHHDSRKMLDKSATHLRRALLICTFLLYIVLCPAISNHECNADNRGVQWAGFVALVVVCLLMSSKYSPLVKYLRIGEADTFIVYLMLLLFNCFLWSAVNCMEPGPEAEPDTEDGTDLRPVLQVVHTFLITVLFLVGNGWKSYCRHSAKEVCATLGARLMLVTMFVFTLTLIVVGPIFSAASFYRSRGGCEMNVDRIVTNTYSPVPFNFTSENGPDVPLDKSLMVGLHNTYHQISPVAGIIQSWGYSHPSLFNQLELGYREIELDVHWPRNAKSWRVFHVTMIDQGTSCSCLIDCLGQIRRWMDEAMNKDHTPILIHIEPRGYGYNDLFCERTDGEARLAHLQQLLFDTFSDRIYFPDELTANYSSIYDALQGRGWPTVGAMKGKVLFNLNLFGSNDACRPMYHAAEGASFDNRLAGSDAFAEDIGGPAVPTSSSIASNFSTAERSQKRKVLFNRGTVQQAKTDNTTCTREVSSDEYGHGPEHFNPEGFITRFRIGTKPEASATIRAIHQQMPVTLISYDGVSPG